MPTLTWIGKPRIAQQIHNRPNLNSRWCSHRPIAHSSHRAQHCTVCQQLQYYNDSQNLYYTSTSQTTTHQPPTHTHRATVADWWRVTPGAGVQACWRALAINIVATHICMQCNKSEHQQHKSDSNKTGQVNPTLSYDPYPELHVYRAARPAMRLGGLVTAPLVGAVSAGQTPTASVNHSHKTHRGM